MFIKIPVIRLLGLSSSFRVKPTRARILACALYDAMSRSTTWTHRIRANLAATEDLAGSDLTSVVRLREESFSAPQSKYCSRPMLTVYNDASPTRERCGLLLRSSSVR